MNKVLLGAVVMIATTSAAAAQTYPYYEPYGYGAVGEPNVAPPIAYGYDPWGTAGNWQYYRSSGPGRGNNEESTR
jgi:hypothetical protein